MAKTAEYGWEKCQHINFLFCTGQSMNLSSVGVELLCAIDQTNSPASDSYHWLSQCF